MELPQEIANTLHTIGLYKSNAKAIAAYREAFYNNAPFIKGMDGSDREEFASGLAEIKMTIANLRMMQRELYPEIVVIYN